MRNSVKFQIIAGYPISANRPEKTTIGKSCQALKKNRRLASPALGSILPRQAVTNSASMSFTESRRSPTCCPSGARSSSRSLTFCKMLKICANFWRARSRLYQNEILQENMRSTTFFKLYKICILLHRCNLKIFAKNRFEKTAMFVKFQQKNCKCRKICKILSNFKTFS